MEMASSKIDVLLAAPQESESESVFEQIGAILDAHTVSECSDLWDQVEKNANALKGRATRNQENTILRVTNIFLRRLSEARDAKLRGMEHYAYLTQD